MIKIFLLSFLFIKHATSSLAFPFEGECFFEEVYKNSQSQNGFLLLSQNQIRYEYLDRNLFTIIYSDNEIKVFNNKTLMPINDLNKQQMELFLNMADSIKQYPYKDNQILKENLTILFEPGISNEFPRRIVVKSNAVNLSIYLYDCISKPINKLFFKSDPLFLYKK